MTVNVKHNGCANCGSKEQEILNSITLPGSDVGKALCDKCISKIPMGVK